MRISVFCRTLICILLAVLILLPSALAEAPDLSSMTDDEIVALLTKVNQEVAKRGIAKTVKLPEGAYIAGTDIPTGKYIFTVLATGDDWGNVTVYSDGGKGKQKLWNVVTAPEKGAEPDTIFITLEKGDQLKSGVPFSLTIMPGAIFQ